MNKRRKACKAQKIGDYHYEKEHYRKALESYLRWWNNDPWFRIRDSYLYKISYCYKCLWEYHKAFKIIEYMKQCGTYTYNSLELKKEICDILWKAKEWKKCQRQLNIIDTEISDNSLLDRYLEHTSS